MSRKNLSLIHLFARVRSVGFNVFETLHEFFVGADSSFTGIRDEPLAKSSVESCVFGLGNGMGFLDEFGFGA